ncbi:hypothetical protein Vretimale_5044 [Volvox reticuliferus]|uniref:Uncharacterized protein n=1 Tax=Volvox reticuliferus TaxID=1737510 RepID=A0A8J4DC37_9CHLO|nr:hypothetical protein Vretifemale_4092 [Volvox reticuliferus]GIL99977.1 hypothetical protein Vretimale_5044 [Volvox reticuliferus]
MAESATETLKGRRAAAIDTEDSIDAELGGEYSEGSLEFFRQLGRKGAQFGQVEPWETEAIQPPAQEECNAAVEELESLDRTLERVKQYTPDAKELAWIDYKRALVEDASDNEVTWLKLKAYHHGLEALRASCAQQEDLTNAPRKEDADASARHSGVAAAREAVLKAVRALLPSSSGDEEDAAPVIDVAGPRLASHAQASSNHVHRAVAGPHGIGPTTTAAATGAAAAAATGTGTVYNPEYLEELRLTQQLAQQRHQRSNAFLFGILAAVGLSTARWLLRRKRGRDGGTVARRPATTVQPVPQ